MRTFLALALAFASLPAAFAQELCVHKLIEGSMIANMEGWFINAQHSRARFDIEWRHHEQEQVDTFFIHLPDRPSIKYITSETSRYIEQDFPKLRRQMAMHHLKDEIGNTPVKYDDLELLAHGYFQCKDTSEQKPNILSTAFSNMWWSVALDSLPKPNMVTMRGARKEKRVIRIDSWKSFSGLELPALATVEHPNYRGNIWIRSIYPIEDLAKDPLRENIMNGDRAYRTFLWIGNEK